MAFSKIIINFNRIVEVGEFIAFKWRDLDVNGGATSVPVNENWYSLRTGPGQVSVTDAVGQAGIEDSMFNWVNAWGIDYNTQNNFTISISGTGVTIVAKKNNIEFIDTLTTAGVGMLPINEPAIPTFQIASVEYLEALTNKCDNIRVRVTTTNPMTRISSPVVIENVNNSVVEFDYTRNALVTIDVEDANTQLSQPARFKDFLLNPTVRVTTTPSGATVNVFSPSSPNLGLGLINSLTGKTYSLDGINYQSSKYFTGIIGGSYIAYAKDTYGCIKTTPFDVDAFSPDVSRGEPTAYVSNTNSIRFKKDEVWDNNSIFRNDTNTLSTEEKAILCVPYIHKYTDQDDIQIQLKTNYENVAISVFDCTTGLTDNPIVLPITDNLNKVDKRDSIGYEFADGRYGFYFQTGNIYDPANPFPVITGSYALYGNLPAWAVIGAYFQIDGLAYAQIISIEFVDSISSYVAIIDLDLGGNDPNVIVQANYDVFNWDAFEFNILMAPYLNHEIQVTISLTDSEFEQVDFVSEKVQVYANLDTLVTIKSKNLNNNDIVYQSGIEHISRLDYDLLSLADESELDIKKGDDTVYQLDGYSYPKKKLSLTRLSTVLARSIRQQLSLDTVIIDGITCRIEEISEPTRIGVTNVYKMEVIFYEVENKIESNIVDTDIELDIVDVPALVQGGDEFVKQ